LIAGCKSYILIKEVFIIKTLKSTGKTEEGINIKSFELIEPLKPPVKGGIEVPNSATL
jgi:hypothetical protein